MLQTRIDRSSLAKTGACVGLAEVCRKLILRGRSRLLCVEGCRENGADETRAFGIEPHELINDS